MLLQFGQAPNQQQCAICFSMAQFYDLVTRRDVELQKIKVVHESCVIVSYNYRSGFVPETGPSNIYIASFTTAHARLKLLSVISKLGERALYCDTGINLFKFAKYS